MSDDAKWDLVIAHLKALEDGQHRIEADALKGRALLHERIDRLDIRVTRLYIVLAAIGAGGFGLGISVPKLAQMLLAVG